MTTASIDKEWQEEVDNKVIRYLKQQAINYVELPKADSDGFDSIMDYATRQAKFMANRFIDMDVQTKL